MKAIALSSITLALFTAGATAKIPTQGPIPKVSGYDFEGKKFSFTENFKDHYTVVVFGCLT